MATPTLLWADPVPVPQWARPVEARLPRVYPSIISEVDDLFKVISNSRHAPDDSGKRADSEYVRASLRLVELREQADQAMIWQYLKEQPAPNESAAVAEMNTVVRRTRLLPRLADDPALPQWLLPLLRERMRWMENQLQTRQINDYNCIHEIIGIESYLGRHGSVEDLEMLEKLISTGTNAGYFEGFFKDRRPLDVQLPITKKAREKAQIYLVPYWVSVAQYLTGAGLVDKSRMNMIYDPKVYSSAELNPMKSQSSHDAPEQNRLKTATTSLSNVILAALALTVIVLLALMLKKRHDAV